MLLRKALPEIISYIDSLNALMSDEHQNWVLTKCQRLWLGFVLSCMLISNSINWQLFERITLGQISFSSYCWMFHHGKILWDQLISLSIKLIIKKYRLTQGVLIIDDTDRPRSKRTNKIEHVHIIKDKSTNGFLSGQNIVFLVIVTDKLTIPVGFKFYEPDPALKAWKKEDKKLRKQKVPKSERPSAPERNPAYPTKSAIALELVSDFNLTFPEFSVKAVLADGLYGYNNFLEGAAAIYPSQVMSQLRNNQLVKGKGDDKYISLVKYFKSKTAQFSQISIRGGDKQPVRYASANLYIKSQGKTRRVVALKYDGEDEYRYIVVTNENWLVTTIVQTYTLRWLVEVFFYDWKENEGWAKMAKQQRAEGSSQGVILSVLLDHCLLLHSSQTARIESKLPAYTVGSLRAKLCVESIVQFVEDTLDSKDPISELSHLKVRTDALVKLMPSKKHMNNRALDVFQDDNLQVAA